MTINYISLFKFTGLFIYTYLKKNNNNNNNKKIKMKKNSFYSHLGLIDQFILSIMDVYTDADCITLDIYRLDTIALRIKLPVPLIHQSRYVYENGL